MELSLDTGIYLYPSIDWRQLSIWFATDSEHFEVQFNIAPALHTCSPEHKEVFDVIIGVHWICEGHKKTVCDDQCVLHRKVKVQRLVDAVRYSFAGSCNR